MYEKLSQWKAELNKVVKKMLAEEKTILQTFYERSRNVKCN